MKSILYLSLLLSLAAAPVNKSPDLHISITLTRSEHSKDSNSTQTTITLSSNKLVYDETHHGFHARPPVHKERTLTTEEISELKRLIKEKEQRVAHEGSAHRDALALATG